MFSVADLSYCILVERGQVHIVRNGCRYPSKGREYEAVDMHSKYKKFRLPVGVTQSILARGVQFGFLVCLCRQVR